MIYEFYRYKNISMLSEIIMLDGLKSGGEVVSHSIGSLKNDETIEQALNRIGVDFDTVYPDYIIQ